MRESGLKSGAQACINRYIVSLHAREWIEIEVSNIQGKLEKGLSPCERVD